MQVPCGAARRGPSGRARSAMSGNGEYTRLVVERRGPVGWLVFNRPDAGNAMDAVMFDELERAWLELDADPSVRVIVNTGEGRAFQTGVDVVQMSADRDALREHSRRTRDAQLRFTAWHCGVWKPVIAAVNGVCAGGGLHFVADADIVIAALDATFVDPHVSLGQVVAYEGIALARKSPMEPILRMALVGRHERMDAARARQLGILSQIVDPPSRLRDEAQALAEKIARNSPAAMAATKKALWGALETGLTDACRNGAQHLAALWGHPDQEEGPLAFTERREAEWVTEGERPRAGYPGPQQAGARAARPTGPRAGK
jgi:enoyl-CoA hydratase